MSRNGTDTDISKFMSFVLRHEPAAAGLTLDQYGWTDFDAFVDALGVKFVVTRDDILRIVAENPKKRFTLEGNRIRAAQGHSLAVDLAILPSVPPAKLFHGTTTTAWTAISIQGLQRMGRTHVHLSSEKETAHDVSKRRKGPHVILSLDAQRMNEDGYVFFLSENNVWLCETVPPQYLTVLMESTP